MYPGLPTPVAFPQQRTTEHPAAVALHHHLILTDAPTFNTIQTKGRRLRDGYFGALTTGSALEVAVGRGWQGVRHRELRSADQAEGGGRQRRVPDFDP